MAKFFFDLADGERTLRDEKGEDFLDVSTALEGARVLANVGIEHVRQPAEAYDRRELHIRAESGRFIAKVAFRYVTA